MPRKSFNLEPRFYKEEMVVQAISDFSDNFSLSYEKEVLTISAETDEEIDEIFHEFANYVVGLSNETV